MKYKFRALAMGLFFLGTIGLFAPATGQAHSVTFDFTGTFVAADPHSIIQIPVTPVGPFPASTISGSFTFDADALDSNGSSTVGQYNGAIENLSFRVTSPILGGFSEFGFNSAGPLNSIAINANSTTVNQSYVLSASVQNVVPAGPLVDGSNYFARDFLINLFKPTSGIFATDALPGTPPSLSPFSLYNSLSNPEGQFRLVLASDHADHILIGNLTSLTLSAVPIPAAVWLFGSGVIGLIGLARRKMHSMV